MEEFKIIQNLEDIDMSRLITVCNGSYHTMQGEYPTGLKFNEQITAEYLTRAILSKNHCVVVAFESNNPVGVATAALVSYPFSAALRAHVSIVALLPGYRNGEFGRNIITHVCSWAIERGALEITAGDVGVDLKRNDNIFEEENWTNRGFWYSRKF
jgi:GNAT superfamily N-acetyltransferase